LLTDDLEDLGAAGSAVLSPIFNLQGASLGSRKRVEINSGGIGIEVLPFTSQCG
jgi:hypothetical protein